MAQRDEEPQQHILLLQYIIFGESDEIPTFAAGFLSVCYIARRVKQGLTVPCHFLRTVLTQVSNRTREAEPVAPVPSENPSRLFRT